MATSSSATSSSSASPPLSYIQAAATILPAAANGGMDPAEREDRKKAVQKFMARAEISMVTRGLRARLSYASYKAAHNIPHVPLRDLEAQSQSSNSRIIGAKRKASSSAGGAGGTNNYYNNPATQGIHNPPNSSTNTRKGLMAPPALSASASRSYYPAPAPAARNTTATPSLYSSILAPPPAKQARTIHNPRDPPIAAPTRPPAAAPRPRRGSKASEHLPAPVSSSTAATTTTGRPRALSLAEGTRSHAKTRRDDPVDSKRKDKRGTKGKHKGRGSSSMDLTHDTDVDMKAAATLTSLLLHARPSMTASTTSPRSSISAGSDSGSVQSFSQFAQSSARTTTTVPSAESSFATQNTRSTTPPPLSSTPSHSMSSVLSDVGGTPRAHAPSDNEAADLMLFLATSPSPARPASNRDKDAKDGPMYRALGGSSGLRAKGRVLFPNSGSGIGNDGGGTLMSEGSFGSSTGGDVCMSDGGELPLRRFESRLSISTVHDGGGGLSAPMEPNVIPPTPTAPTPGQLLPPPPSPSINNNNWQLPLSYVSADPETTPRQQAPPTPGGLSFNLNDFINVSPSPATPVHGGGFKQGLRADVGRRLFGEEQARQSGEQLRNGGGALGAGIDLIK